MNKALTDILHQPINLNRKELSFAHTNTQSMTEWVQSLSLLQLGDTAQALFEALIEISELECSETLRFDLLQILQPQFEHVLRHLEEHFFNQGLIHSDRNEHIIELAFQLRTYFAHAYIIIVKCSAEQLRQQKFSLFRFHHKKNLKVAQTLAIYYAMQQFTQLLYQQHMLYSQPVYGQWQRIHWLFDIAQKNRIEHQNINQLQGVHYTLKNISLLYQQLILLHILNTNQIRQSEIQALYQCSFEWAKLLDIEFKETQTSKYVIDKKIDQVPTYNKKQYPHLDPDFFISTQPLLEHITATLHKTDDYLSPVERQYLTPALKFHVQNILGSIGERRHERFESSGQLHICFGITTAHYYISRHKNFTDSLPHSELSSFYETQDRIKVDSSFFQASARLSREAKRIYQSHILDMSVSGYRIKWSDEVPKNLKTGEFILVKEGTHSSWRGGVIRWIKQSSEKNLEMGLEILSKNILPCTLLIQEVSNQQIPVLQPGLLLQSLHLDHGHMSLVSPNITSHEQQQSISIYVDQQKFELYLLKTQLITQSFIQFEFELFDELQKNMLKNVMISQSRGN